MADSSFVFFNNWIFLCSCKYARYINRNNIFDNCKLDTLSRHFALPKVKHRAFSDCVACHQVMKKMVDIDNDINLKVIKDYMLIAGDLPANQYVSVPITIQKENEPNTKIPINVGCVIH